MGIPFVPSLTTASQASGSSGVDQGTRSIGGQNIGGITFGDAPGSMSMAKLAVMVAVTALAVYFIAKRG
jgi:hypothetical protein